MNADQTLIVPSELELIEWFGCDPVKENNFIKGNNQWAPGAVSPSGTFALQIEMAMGKCAWIRCAEGGFLHSSVR
jgi:hypothetical protein